MFGKNIFLQDGNRKKLKRKKIYAAFMDLDKAYDTVGWEVLRYMMWEENCLVQ